MRVLVFGSRELVKDEHREHLWSMLDDALSGQEDVTVVEGECRGPDVFGREWATSRGHEVEPYPAQWARYGGAAGPIRNQQMLDTGIDLGVGLFVPWSRGSKDMLKKLKRAGVEVITEERLP